LVATFMVSMEMGTGWAVNESSFNRKYFRRLRSGIEHMMIDSGGDNA